MSKRPLIAALLLVAAPAAAQTAPADDRIRITVTPYVWLSGVDSDIDFRGNTQTVSLSAGDILAQLKFAVMARTVIEKGRFGFVTDLVYANLSDSESASRDLELGEAQLPANVTADIELDTKVVILTLAPRYRLIDTPNYKLHVLAGTRYFHQRQDLEYTLSGNVGGVPVPDRQGDLSAKIDNWDFIAGIGGEYSFGAENKWFLPFAVDFGGGESKFTWEALGGIGHRFGWGDVVLVYRHISYDLSGEITSYRQHGPALGATFRF